MTVIDAANRAAVLHLLGDAFYRAAKEHKALTLDEMHGRGTLYPTLPDGTEIASVNVPKASVTVTITNEQALAHWVAEQYPSEIVEHCPVVQPAFLDKLKDLSRSVGEPCAPDGTLDIPGLTVTTTPPSAARVKATDQGRERAEQVVSHAQQNALNYLAGNIDPATLSGGEDE